MRVVPHLFGERHNPTGLASIHNIGRSDLDITGIMRSFARGIIQNLRSMMESRQKDGLKHTTHLVACGSAVTRNPFIREAICKYVFPDMTITVKSDVDAAHGAALAIF